MKKNYLLFGIIALILIAGIVYFTPVKNTIVNGVECGSTSALSIDKVDFDDGTNKIRVFARAGTGSAECLKINFDKTQLEQKLEQTEGGDWVVSKTVTGSFTKISQKEVFPVNKNSQRVYMFAKLEKATNTNFGTCVGITKPSNALSPIAYRQGGLFDSSCYWVVAEPNAYDGEFGETRDRKFNVQFTIDGLTPITLTESSTTGSNEKAFVRWEGDLLRNQWLERPNYDALFFVANNNWRFIKDGTWNSYQTVFNNFKNPDSYPDGWNYLAITEINDVTDKVSRYNTEIVGLIADQKSEFLARNPIIETIDTQSGNLFTANLATPLTSGLFTIELDAGWVGVKKVSGVPNLTCPTGGFLINSGDTKSQSFTVKNKGTSTLDRASFNLGVECDGQASGQLSTYGVDLLGGQSKSVTVTASGLSDSGTQTQSCTITAKDVNSQQSDSCTFSFQVKEVTTDCIDTMCVGADLWECKDNGDYNIVSCQYGCDARNNVCYGANKEICNDGIDNDSDGKTDKADTDCQTPIDFQTIIPIILGVLMGLVVFGIGYKYFVKPKKQIDYVMLVIAIAISLGLGYLSFLISKLFIDFVFSLAGLITGIVLVVVGLFLKKIKVI